MRYARGGVNENAAAATTAAAAAVEPQKKARSGKGGKKNNSKVDLTGDDDDTPADGKKATKCAQQKDQAKWLALEKRSEDLQKQLEDLIAQNKENERKRKKEDAENLASSKALKKSLEAAEREKEKALEKAAMMEAEKENRQEQASGAAGAANCAPTPSSAPTADQPSVLGVQQQIPNVCNMTHGLQNVLPPSHQQLISVAHASSANGGLNVVPQTHLQQYQANPTDALMSFWDQQDLRTEMKGRLQLMQQLFQYR